MKKDNTKENFIKQTKRKSNNFKINIIEIEKNKKSTKY